MQRRAKILGFTVQVCVELCKDLNHLDVAFVASDMQRCPAIRVALVKQSLFQLRVLLYEQVVTSLEIAFLCVYPYVPQKTPLLFLVLLTLRLQPSTLLLLFYSTTVIMQ